MVKIRLNRQMLLIYSEMSANYGLEVYFESYAQTNVTEVCRKFWIRY